MPRIDEFKEFARKRIVERLRDDKINSYDGEDAVYEGSDEEYQEFLDGLDIELDKEAEPVENTQRIDLKSVKNVLNKVKEKAESITEAVTSKVMEKGEEILDNDETCFEKLEDEVGSGIDEVKAAIADTMNDSMQKIDGLDERLGDVSEDFVNANKKLDKLCEAVTAIEKRIQALETQNSAGSESVNKQISELKQDLSELKPITEQIRDAVNGVSKLSDSVFDMKNSQQNTKTVLTDVQTAFARLKKKVTVGIIILSIIGFITIALEVVNLLA